MGNVTDLGMRKYYVVFLSRINGNGPYEKILDKQFRHVFLITKINEDQTLIIDPLYHAVHNSIKNKSIERVIEILKSIEGSHIVYYNKPVSRREKWRFRGQYNCVTYTKAILNIWCWSLTPKQLFKYLIRTGGLIIKG